MTAPDPKPDLTIDQCGWFARMRLRGRLAIFDPLGGPTRRSLPSSAPHEAFALIFRPGEGLLHRLAPRVAEAHLGQRRLHVDLLCDSWRGRRGRDRQRLMVIGI